MNEDYKNEIQENTNKKIKDINENTILVFL